ncbi:MAG: putative lipid II flippase FtsW [Myxococcales bacterium]|jgi:cell division protein FtsW|nr:putative lipid II flippase FtsW [Myxococcales bacterium]
MQKTRELPKNRPAKSEAPPEKKPLAPISELLHSSPDGPVDSLLAATVIALIGFGVVMVYSASAVEATTRYKDPEFFLKRQAIWGALALFGMWVASRIDYRRLKALTYPILLSVIGMLTLTVVGFGHRAGNADRWLNLGPIHIQPAELAKLAIVLWLAYSLSKKADQIKSFAVGFLPHLFVCGVLMLLCLKQPDFGSSVVLLFLTFTMLFVAGAKVPYIAAFTMLLGLGAAAAIRFTSYRYARYVAWIDMDAHRDGLAYQPFQSVMSFGSGGTWGQGLGRGLQVLYLPEAHTDFVSAIIGEELGFVGIACLAAAYLVVVARGVKVALNAADDYGSFLAFGISTLFGVQALTNLAVAMAILPTKGLTLPFISYGGSSLLVNAAAIGVLLGISRPRRRIAPDNKKKEPQKPLEPLPSATAVVLTNAEQGAAEW